MKPLLRRRELNMVFRAAKRADRCDREGAASVAGRGGWVGRPRTGVDPFGGWHRVTIWRCPKILDKSNPLGYTPSVILRFRHKGLERLFTTGNARGVSAQHVRKIQLILAQLNLSRAPSMMDAPGLRLHSLVGDRRGQWAVWVSGNWRIVFEFEDGNATNVDLVDYH